MEYNKTTEKYKLKQEDIAESYGKQIVATLWRQLVAEYGA